MHWNVVIGQWYIEGAIGAHLEKRLCPRRRNDILSIANIRDRCARCPKSTVICTQEKHSFDLISGKIRSRRSCALIGATISSAKLNPTMGRVSIQIIIHSNVVCVRYMKYNGYEISGLLTFSSGDYLQKVSRPSNSGKGKALYIFIFFQCEFNMWD